MKIGMQGLKKYNPDYYLPIIILIISAFVFLTNISRNHLWQDEAQTALISKSILSNGIPHGCDGNNSYSQELGAETGISGVYKWHPWFPFYVHAVFFQLFGQSDFISRLPDALFGIATVLVCFWIMRSTGSGIRPSILASLTLVLMVPFLLLSRQCRYYSMVSFFSMCSIWAYFLLYSSRKYSGLFFIGSAVILFHIQMVYCAVFLAIALIHSAFYGKDFFKRISKYLALILILTLPWLVYISDISYKSRYNLNLFSMFFAKRLFTGFLIQLEDYVVPLYLIALAIIVIAWNWKRIPDIWHNMNFQISFYFLYVLLTLITLSLTAPDSFFRYLSFALPIIAIAIASVTELGFQKYKIAGFIILIISFLHQPFTDYYFELTHRFKGPIEGLVEHFNKYAQPTDTVAITYGDMPVKWYTGLHVVGGLAGDDMKQVKNARWIVIRKYTICMKDLAVSTNLYAQLHDVPYRKILINAPDTPFENREDPQSHLYRSAIGEAKVVIYERINESKE